MWPAQECDNVPVPAADQFERPRLKILVEPEPYYRFRYASEMQDGNKKTANKFYGPLKGDGGDHPTIQLLNYDNEDDEVFIEISLLTVDDKPHVHKIAFRDTESGAWNVQPSIVLPICLQNFKGILKDLIIVRTVEKDWIGEKVQSLVTKYEEENRQPAHSDIKIHFEKLAKDYWKKLTLNQVKLRFAALTGCNREPICEPLLSRILSNQNDSTVGELKISKLSPYRPKKNDELVLLVSKIAKSAKVKVRIYEGDENNPTWEKYVENPGNHHQVALYFRVPELKEGDLFLQLERTESNGSKSRSEARDFSYEPQKIRGKRRHASLPNPSSANQKLSRLVGHSSSVGTTELQGGQQLLHQTNSCPNVSIGNQYGHQTSGLQGSANNLQEQHNVSENIEGEQQNFGIPDNYYPQQQLDPILIFDGSQTERGGMETDQNMEADVNEAFPTGFPSDLSSLINKMTMPDLGGDITWESDLSTDKRGKDHSHRLAHRNSKGTENADCETDGVQHSKPHATMDPDILTSLYEMALIGNARELKGLLKKMEPSEWQKLVNHVYSEDQTALIIAVDENHAKCVEILCKAGANVNFVDADDNTAFHIAVERNHAECLEVLLHAKDKKLEKKNANGETALHLAVLHNRIESVKMLLEAKANVNEKNGTAGLTPLHLAVQYGYTDLVKLLLEQGNINMNEKSYDDKTAADLVKANQDCIIRLFKQGIDIIVGEDENEDEEE